MVFSTKGICQKLREPSFWKITDSFVLLTYAGLAASRTLLQQLLACLNKRVDFLFLMVFFSKT